MVVHEYSGILEHLFGEEAPVAVHVHYYNLFSLFHELRD